MIIFLKNKMPLKITHSGKSDECAVCQQVLKKHGKYNLDELLINKKCETYQLIRPNGQPTFFTTRI